jgi:hypothetical protein
MPEFDDESEAAEKLVAFARAKLDFKEIIKAHSRGGQVTLLFLRSGGQEGSDIQCVWINAWLVTDEHVEEIERSSDHLQGRYIQRGFHPGYGSEGDALFYEPIYGRPAEPLVLGWSADGRQIDPEPSQELVRCYKLTKTGDKHRLIWNSWQEAIDDVVVMDRNPRNSSTIVIRTDFLEDFQFLRKRWLLIGVYGEWGKRSTGGPHIRAVDREAKKHKLHLFAVGEDSGYRYLEVQGYFLYPIPKVGGFSCELGLGVPAGLKATVENMEFLTSEGRLKAWEVYKGDRHGAHASATVDFDQEVLRRYQREPGADVSLDNIGQLQITTKKIHLYRMTMLLGTEYVSLWLGDFVVGVPPSEWAHWHSFNVPFIGLEKQKELFAAKNLFWASSQLIRLTRFINIRWRRAVGDDGIPFNLHHHTQKDYSSLTKALPRQADAQELIDRAKALDGLIVERIAANGIRTFLRNCGYPAEALGTLASIKLLSTFMIVARLAQAVEGWHRDSDAALRYAQEKVLAWQGGNLEDLNAEELEIVNETVPLFEILFLVHGLRLLAAHPTTSQLQAQIRHLFEKHAGQIAEVGRYRELITAMYDSLARCLEECAR